MVRVYLGVKMLSEAKLANIADVLERAAELYWEEYLRWKKQGHRESAAGNLAEYLRVRRARRDYCSLRHGVR